MSRRTRSTTAADYTRAGPVVTIRPDGTREVAEPYTADEFERLVRAGQEAPRAWDDTGPGRYGGGNDFKT